MQNTGSTFSHTKQRTNAADTPNAGLEEAGIDLKPEQNSEKYPTHYTNDVGNTRRNTNEHGKTIIDQSNSKPITLAELQAMIIMARSIQIILDWHDGQGTHHDTHTMLLDGYQIDFEVSITRESWQTYKGSHYQQAEYDTTQEPPEVSDLVLWDASANKVDLSSEVINTLAECITEKISIDE